MACLTTPGSLIGRNMLQLLLTVTLLMPAAEKLTAKIEFRGVPARDALRQVGEAAGARVILARQIPPEQLDRDVRVELEHVTPEQAVRWIARLAGLEAITTSEGLYVLTPGQLAARGRKPEGGAPVLLAGRLRGDTTRYETTLPDEAVEPFELSGAIFWQDTPITRVASDVARIFGVDLIVDPAIAEDAPLLEWEEPETDLRQVCRFLSQQLSARIVYQDGVLYATALEVTTQPAGDAAVDVPGSRPSFIEVGTRDEVTDDAEADAPPELKPRTTTRPVRAVEVDAAGPAEPTPPPIAKKLTVLPTEPANKTTPPSPSPVQSGAATRPAPQVIFPAPRKPAADNTENKASSPPVLPPSSTSPRRRNSNSKLPAGRLQIDASVRDWEMLARRVEAASGGVCRIKGAGRPFEPIEADGPLGQVLESLRLMGRLDFSCSMETGGTAVIEITPAPRS